MTRLVGGATGVGGGYGATIGAALGGGPGPLRLFDAEVGGQIAWLLPLALGALVVVAARLRSRVVPIVTGLATIVAGPMAYVVDTAVRPVSVLESADPSAGPPSTSALSSVVGVNTGEGAEAAYIRFMDSAYQLSPGQHEVLAYVKGTTLAVEGGTYGADPFLLNTDARVAPRPS